MIYFTNKYEKGRHLKVAVCEMKNCAVVANIFENEDGDHIATVEIAKLKNGTVVDESNLENLLHEHSESSRIVFVLKDLSSVKYLSMVFSELATAMEEQGFEESGINVKMKEILN